MNLAFGLGFLVAAVVVAMFGDRQVQERRGFVLKALSWPKPLGARLKFPIAALLAGVGVWFLTVGVA